MPDKRDPDNCPHCGRGAASEDRFCGGCGHDLSANVCPACGARAAMEARFCTTCGAALTGGPAVAVARSPTALESPPADGEALAALGVTAGPPAGWDPGPADTFELPDERTAISDAIAGDPVPFEPRQAPADGMAGWREPVGTGQPEVQLAGGADLIVIERTGAWAHVMGENGWNGWVDDRLLIDPDLAIPG